MKSFVYQLAEQFRLPRGFFGQFVGNLMKRYNREAIIWTVSLLNLRQTDHVLEIGFGPGIGVREVWPKVKEGRVDGIDLSPKMVAMASRMNAAGVADGTVNLINGDVANLPYTQNNFDKVFAVNVYYFWDDPKAPLREIKRTLKPGGQVVLYLLEKHDLLKLRQARTEVFRKHENEEVLKALQDTGFENCRLETKKIRNRTGVCVIGRKPK